jgi:O-antigen/teichoic acid export membrane protein
VLWQASGNTAAQLLGIAAMPILTRLYAPGDFGALNLFAQAVAALAIVMTLRFEYLVMLPADQEESDRILRLVVRLGALHVLLWTPLLVYMPGRWDWLGAQGQIADWLWLAPLSAWGVSVAMAVQQAVQRRGNFRLSGGSEFVGRCAYVASGLIGSLALPNIIGLMCATAANAGAKLLWLIRFRKDRSGSLLHGTVLPLASSVKRLALSTSFSNLIALISGMAPMLFIAERYGTSALGQYGLVISTLYLPSALLGQAIGQVYYQRACRLHQTGTNFTDLLVQTSWSLMAIGAPVYGLVGFLAPKIYPLIFGAEWAEAGQLARWMCIAAAVGFVTSPFDRSSVVVGVWWYLTAWHALRAGATVMCLLLGQMVGLSLTELIILLSFVNAGVYAVDWLASRHFSGALYAPKASPLFHGTESNRETP